MTAKSTNKRPQQQAQTALQHRPDPSVACFALHPSNGCIAIAVNDIVRIGDSRQSSQRLQTVQNHQAPVRAVAFDATGKYFLSAGDEKLVKVWDTKSWSLLHTVQSPKKVTAALFSPDSNLVVFADKFGDVLTAKLQFDQANPTSGPAAPLLGHLCSIVTSLAFSPDGLQLVSTDQDCKVRVSTMPAEPCKGAHSIQSICMGHEVFAKCCSFACPTNESPPLLLSGGGDSTIRSWRHLSGEQLDCFTCITEGAPSGSLQQAAPVASVTGASADGGVPAASAMAQSDAAKHDMGDGDVDDADMEAAQASEEPEDEATHAETREGAADALGDGGALEGTHIAGEGDHGDPSTAAAKADGRPAVLSISTAPDGCTVAAAIEGRDIILILHCDPSTGKLSQHQEVQLPGVALPTQVQFDSEGRVWVVGGPLTGSTHAACIGVASSTGAGPDRQWQHDQAALTDEVKVVLEDRDAGSQHQNSGPNAALSQQQVNQQLRKRVYSTEEREARKKNRNDLKA